MDQLDAMRVYVAVVESQGFSAASRALGIPVPTVSRKVAHLEEKLGVQLLVRSTRKVSATSSGMRYYDDARRILEDINGANRRVAGEYQQIKGLLTITAPALFGRLYILPIVNDFMRLHDEVEVRLLLTNHMLDMLEEHIDLGVSIGSRSSGSMKVVPVTEMRLIVCASPQYLSAAGRPSKPDDLLDHETIPFARSCMQYPWPFKMPAGDIREVNLKSRLLVNTAEAAVDSVLARGTSPPKTERHPCVYLPPQQRRAYALSRLALGPCVGFRINPCLCDYADDSQRTTQDSR